MSQPVDTVYVEILPDVKGFDRRLATKLKRQIEGMFKNVSPNIGGNTGGGRGSSGGGSGGGSGGFFPLGGAMADPRRFRLQQKMAALAKKSMLDQQRAIDEIHRRALIDDKRRLAEDEQFRRAVEENNRRDEMVQRDHIRALIEEGKRQQAAQDEIHRRAIAEDRRRQQEVDNQHIAALREDRRRIQEMNLVHAEALREERRRAREQETEQRARQARGGAFRQFSRGIRGAVPRGRTSTPIEMAGEVINAPFKMTRGALNSVSNLWEDITGSMEAARFVALSLAAVMGGRLVTAAAASLPLIAGMAAAAFGTIMLGFEGTSKARDRFDAEMESLKPTFEEIRNEASRGLFQGFEGEITRVTENLKGPVKEGVFEVGQAWQFVAKGVTEYLSSARGAEVVNHIFDTTARLLRQWRPAVDAAMEGFGDLSIKATPFVEKLNQKLSQGVTNFFNKVSEMAEDGSLEKFFKDAVDDVESVVQLLGDAKDLAKDIGQLLPTDLLKDLAERSRKNDFREAYDNATNDSDRARLANEEANRRLSREGTAANFSKPGFFSTDADKAAYQNMQDALNSLAFLNKYSTDDPDFAAHSQVFLQNFNEMQNLGMETDKLWDGLVTANREKAAQLYLTFSESNKMAANDYRDSWLERNNISREEWDKFLVTQQEKYDQNKEAARLANQQLNEQDAAARAQNNANASAAQAQGQLSWSNFWGGVKSVASGAWQTITSTNTVGVAGMLTSFQKARNEGQGFWNSLWSGIVGGAQAAWNNVKRIWSTNPAAQNFAAGAATGGVVGGLVSWASSAIKGYATGGVFEGPTIAQVGEGGDELAFPLTGSHGDRAMDRLVSAMARNSDFQGLTGGVGGSGAVGTGPGIRVWDSQPQATNTNTLVIDSGGSALDDLIVEVISKVVRDRNGDPVQVFSAGRFQGVPA